MNKNVKRLGVMLDCSRNAVMRPEQVKKFASLIKKMGYNTIMLYTEDTYEVKNEPLFGYMRGAYSIEEIKDMDAYLRSIGTELIPCIQTLAHFTNLVRLGEYKKIVDCNDILLIDDDRTYELLDNIFATLEEAFSSRIVNIGMDEAHMVGLGRYLDEHGFADRTELLLRHLNKVCEIAKKHGFTTVMWSDMFFRLATGGDYYAYGVSAADEVKKYMPEGLALAYWDYYHVEKESYDRMLAAHKTFGREVWFAGGAWSWNGFAPMNSFSMRSMFPAMQSVIENKIENVIITMWGDNGKDCSFYALLPSLYAISATLDGVSDMEKIKSGFKDLIGIAFDDFMLLDYPNYRKAGTDGGLQEPLSKALLYADPFVGKSDRALQNIGKIDYKGYAELLENQAKVSGEYAYLFENLAKLCRALEIKYDLGVRTRLAYAKDDKAELLRLATEDYLKAAERVAAFHDCFEDLWHKENKDFGFEVQSARLGGLVMRLKSCARKLKSYVGGEIDCIDQLEKPLLTETSDEYITYSMYNEIISYNTVCGV